MEFLLPLGGLAADKPGHLAGEFPQHGQPHRYLIPAGFQAGGRPAILEFLQQGLQLSWLKPAKPRTPPEPPPGSPSSQYL